ncbi:MAG: thiamine pyrophosphate-binding protein [Oligoflexia bacterium]|nr:thiamine pyrophosphate-binding protein [Oligoflexia bacterium]
MIKLSDYVVQFLENLKIKNVFMLPGGGCMHLVDSFGKSPSINYVCCLHEQAAVIAADGYAQYNNSLGVALVTTGPGGTNAITGVAASWIDSIPVLIISGQAKRQDLRDEYGVRQMGVQEVAIRDLVKPITKYVVTVKDPALIKYHLQKAVHLATEGRFGPVWIDLPLDVQGSMIDETTLESYDPDDEIPLVSQNIPAPIIDEKINQAISLLKESRRPVILAGNGVRLSGALDAFKELINKLSIPVLTTWKSIDFLPENHPLFFGRPGAVASRYANFIQQNSDLLIVLAARLDLPQVAFDNKNFATKAKKIIVDIDENELKKWQFQIDVSLNMNVAYFISKINSILLNPRISINTNITNETYVEKWRAYCQDLKKRFPVVTKNYYDEVRDGVNTYVLVNELSKHLDANDLIIPGSSGSCSEVMYQAFQVKEGQRFLNSPGLGSMGFGVAQSIGGAITSGKRTICVIGDGGLQHNIQELETLRRLNLNLKIFVLNNNGYASIRMMQQRHFNGRLVACDPTSGLTFPNLSKICDAYDLSHTIISNQNQLIEKLPSFLSKAGPAIAEIIVDPSFQMIPRVSSEVRADGSIVSKPMEDLWPFLDRTEFNNIMSMR